MCTVQYMNYKSIYVTTGVSSRPTPALTTQHSPLTLHTLTEVQLQILVGFNDENERSRVVSTVLSSG